MKKIFILVFLGLGVLMFAQHHPKKGDELERKIEQERGNYPKNFKKFSPEEKRVFFQGIQAITMVEKLHIPKEKAEVSEKLFLEYFKERDNIIRQFKPNEIKENITNEEALKKIKKGFDTAQKLLDLRKKYTDRFLKDFTPHQVLKIFKIEKEMLNHFKEKHKEKKEK